MTPASTGAEFNGTRAVREAWRKETMPIQGIMKAGSVPADLDARAAPQPVRKGSLARGVLIGLAIVAPFWTAVAYLLLHALR